MARFDIRQLPEVEPDGLAVMDVFPHAVEKYRLVWTYDVIFTNGMRKQWDELVYLDLFSGPGHARIAGGRTILGSPLLALSIPHPFTHYVFCERDPGLFAALQERVGRHELGSSATCIHGDANEEIQTILDGLPRPSRNRRMLTFCFVDPHKSGDIEFDSIERLARARFVDFLVLLPTGTDFKRAIAAYEKPESKRIETWMADERWREEWAKAKRQGEKLNTFFVRRFAEQMKDRLEYLYSEPAESQPIYHTDLNYVLYHLAFFTKHPRGQDFWRKARKSGGSDQRELGLLG